MLIVTAHNVTGDGKLTRADGTADYDVWVGINQRCIWRGSVNGHVRKAGAGALLRLIAARMEENGEYIE
jgi:hypothetical protein